MHRIRIIEVQVLYLRTTSLLDWCWKSKESYETSSLFFACSLSWHWAMTCHVGSSGLLAYYNFCGFPLGVIRILDQTRPLLIVLEHASGSWLASAQDSYQWITGVVSSNYIFAWWMLTVPGILFEEIVFSVSDASGSRFWSLSGSLQAAFWPLGPAKMAPSVAQERPRNGQERPRGLQEAPSSLSLMIF